MIINNKLEGSNELVGIKSSEKNTEIEALFAELFALVNLDSIDSEKTSLQEQSTKEIDTNVNLTESNKNTINIAKSLAEVFYKELGIDNKSIDKESKNKNNIINPENREISFKDLKNSKLTTDLKNIVSLNLNKKTPEFKNNPEMNKDLSEQKVFKTQNLEIKIKKIEKNNFENDIKKINIVDKPNKSPEINQLKNINTNTNENRVKSSKETNILLKENQKQKIGNLEFEVIFIPGHTKGHIAFFFSKEKTAFTGDTLFSLGCGRVFEGTHEEMFYSLNKIKNLPPDTKIYCGHEYTKSNLNFCLAYDTQNTFLKEKAIDIQKKLNSNLPTIPTILGQEIKTNIFLRCNDPEIKLALDLKDSSEVEVFSKLRDLKDSF